MTLGYSFSEPAIRGFGVHDRMPSLPVLFEPLIDLVCVDSAVQARELHDSMHQRPTLSPRG